jgi:hypothetical protein
VTIWFIMSPKRCSELDEIFQKFCLTCEHIILRKSDCHIWAFFNFLVVDCNLHLCIHVLNFSNKVGIKIFVFFTCYSQPILAKIKLCTLRRLDRIVPVHFFRSRFLIFPNSPQGGGSRFLIVPYSPQGGGSRFLIVPCSPQGGRSRFLIVPYSPRGRGSRFLSCPLLTTGRGK